MVGTHADRVVALLRGINLGRHNKVPMAGLRAGLTAAGFAGVQTYVASGNVVLERNGEDPDALAAQVRALVAEQFDVDVPCLARTGDELDASLRADPLGSLPRVAEEPSRHTVVFLDAEPEQDRLTAVDPEAHLPGSVALMLCADTASGAVAGAGVDPV